MTAEVLTGEVIISGDSTPEAKAEALKAQEKIIRRNWKAAEQKTDTVARALTYIHSFDLWKLHKDENGKRKYTNFETYLSEEFGWTLTRVRALQIIKKTRAEMIEAGELPAETAEPRTRTAPEVTSERASKVTAQQLQKVLDAFATRVVSIDEGDPDRETVVQIYNDLRPEIGAAIDRLLEVVESAANASADAGADAEAESDEADDAAE